MAGLLGSLISPITTPTSGETGTFVRVSHDISDGEKRSLAARKITVSKWYAKQGINVDPENVPVVALMLSGGGLTAMLSCVAVLDELQRNDLLDAAVYTFACSGSTWAMAFLNESGNWSEKLPELKEQLAARVSGLPLQAVPGLLKTIAAAEREDFSLTDPWAYLVVATAVNELNDHTVSGWRPVQESGTVPYLVIATVEKQIYEATDWTTPGPNVEHTVHETGFPHQGIFVDTARFGCKFENNALTKKEPEQNMTFMQGMWGSAFGSIKGIISIMLDALVGMIENPVSNLIVPALETLSLSGVFPGNDPVSKVTQLLSHLQSILSLGGDEQKTILADMSKAMSVKPDTVSNQWIKYMGNNWDSISDTDKANMIKLLPPIMAVELTGITANIGKALLKTATCLVTWEWGTTNNFAKGLATLSDPLKDRLKIYLVDSGFVMMVPYPLAQRPQRNVTLYITCDFYPPDPFRTVIKAAEYSVKNNLLFPKVIIPAGDEFNPSQDCYMFEEPNKPTVMHFPLINKVNSGGLIKVYTVEYAFIRTEYSRGEIDKLMELAASNIRNNASKIREQILKLVAK